MLPINIIRENPDLVKVGIAAKSEEDNVNQIIALDKEQRLLLNELNEKRARRNRVSEEIGKAKSQEKKAAEAIKEMQGLSGKIKNLESNLAALKNQLEPLMYKIPNLPHDSVPSGSNPEDNVVIREWGEKPKFDFKKYGYRHLLWQEMDQTVIQKLKDLFESEKVYIAD